jgi:hypothetical protein
MDEESFKEAIRHAKIPILVLDQKWHRLFAISGKPDEVKSLEVEMNELLQLQGKLNTEQRELKKLKNRLMNNIVSNMDNAGDGSMENDKRLIDETNEKIKANEDELLDLPNRIKETDGALMMATMRFCYAKLRTNASEAAEIAEWIKNVRIELKKNIIKKQNREINNKEIYSYMHDIFGKDVRFEEETKDYVTVSTSVTEAAMIQFAKSYSPDVVILEPQRMVDKMKDWAKKVKKAYGG